MGDKFLKVNPVQVRIGCLIFLVMFSIDGIMFFHVHPVLSIFNWVLALPFLQSVVKEYK